MDLYNVNLNLYYFHTYDNVVVVSYDVVVEMYKTHRVNIYKTTYILDIRVCDNEYTYLVQGICVDTVMLTVHVY